MRWRRGDGRGGPHGNGRVGGGGSGEKLGGRGGDDFANALRQLLGGNFSGQHTLIEFFDIRASVHLPTCHLQTKRSWDGLNHIPRPVLVNAVDLCSSCEAPPQGVGPDEHGGGEQTKREIYAVFRQPRYTQEYRCTHVPRNHHHETTHRPATPPSQHMAPLTPLY